MGGTAKSSIVSSRCTYNASYFVPTNKTIDPKKICPEDKEYDLVYILKRSEKNQDLRISLRSVSKFCTFRNIWFIGYKPMWTKNVKFIPTVQTQDKWKNSMVNYKTACQCKDISDNFILMNDDFFALTPIYNWRNNLNVCLGTLENERDKYMKNENKSRWQYGFEQAIDLLDELNCKNHLNYETHLPIIINKQKFLEMLKKPEILSFNNTNKVLHKRSVYKNLYPDTDLETPKIINDVKITLKFDLNEYLAKGDWLSVFDNVVGNSREYPKLNYFISKLYPEKCIYEK